MRQLSTRRILYSGKVDSPKSNTSLEPEPVPETLTWSPARPEATIGARNSPGLTPAMSITSRVGLLRDDTMCSLIGPLVLTITRLKSGLTFTWLILHKVAAIPEPEIATRKVVAQMAHAIHLDLDTVSCLRAD